MEMHDGKRDYAEKLLNEARVDKMTEKRFESKYDGAFIVDKTNNRTYCCDAQNDWLSICDLLNELSEKPFLKIIDDYYIKFGDEGELFNLHKPSDIRSLIYLINRENGFSELQCEYNDLTIDGDYE